MREIYKVAYDEVERAGAGRRRPSGCGPRSARRGRRATATGRRSTPPGRSSRRPRTCSSGSAPGPRASPRRRSCGCERRHSPRGSRSRGRLQRERARAALAGAARPPAAGAAVRGAGGGGRGARRCATFLADPGRRARIYADLARSLRADVLVVNDADEAPDVLADLLRRVRAVVPEPTLLGVT